MNKANPHVDLAVFFDALSSEFWPGMIQATSAQSDSIRQHAIHVWKWVSKALLVHNHPSGASFAQKLFEVFNDESTEVAWAAARAAGEIGGSDTILIKRHHAIIRVNELPYFPFTFSDLFIHSHCMLRSIAIFFCHD
jgi:DNA repair/transcription protein MET18/MMS19